MSNSISDCGTNYDAHNITSKGSIKAIKQSLHCNFPAGQLIT